MHFFIVRFIFALLVFGTPLYLLWQAASPSLKELDKYALSVLPGMLFLVYLIWEVIYYFQRTFRKMRRSFKGPVAALLAGDEEQIPIINNLLNKGKRSALAFFWMLGRSYTSSEIKECAAMAPLIATALEKAKEDGRLRLYSRFSHVAQNGPDFKQWKDMLQLS